MKLSAYLKDRFLLLLLHIVCMGIVSGFLRITGYNEANIILILLFWAVILSSWLIVVYMQRRKFFREADRILDHLDQRYLLGELLPDSFDLEDRMYRNMIRRSNKSVIERIRRLEDEKQDYKEYIESWVHEVKAPMTGIALLCENAKKMNCMDDGGLSVKNTLRSVSLENQKIENFVDMVLYYARSEHVYKDYYIKETNLQETVCEVLEKNRMFLIQNHVQADVDCRETVYTDRKWMLFILNQIILNSVKYCSGSLSIYIFTKRTPKSVILYLKDNGIGIREEELPRIFEKGFTGSNGRSHERSTGMGLYLCRRLCGRLGIEIRAESVYGEGTCIILEYPVSNYVSR